MSRPIENQSNRSRLFPVTSTPLRALLWGVSLFAGIVVTGLQIYPALVGRVILALIAAGFLLFAIARASVRGGGAAEAVSLSSPMRVAYWTGYALMLSGVLLSAVIYLSS